MQPNLLFNYLYCIKSFKLLRCFKLVSYFLFLLVATNACATHYRAGEIVFEQLNGRTFKITAYSYTDPDSDADRSTAKITLSFGDNSTEEVPRAYRVKLNSKVVQNVYQTIHSYNSDGEYTISFIDQNRVNGIININNGNTQFIAFCVVTKLKINNTFGPNRSPILTKPPLDEGCVFRKFYHNPSAYDPDGDSLTFQLVPPKQSPTMDVPNYSHPYAGANGLFEIGLNDGQLIWDNPQLEGIYNIAILISEFRAGRFIGSVVRDMQITIARCSNDAPIIQDVDDGCVVIGDSISRTILANDPQAFQNITLTGYGGPFYVNRKSTYTPNPAVGQGSVGTLFKWIPSCNQIRYFPWQVVFEAKDDESSRPAVSQNSFFVEVIGPKVLNLKTSQIGNGFNLTWNRDTCGLVGAYKIYRKVDSSNFAPAYCQKGLPESAGYTLINTISTINNPQLNSFYDNNNGLGLSPLINYCYRIVAVYPPRDQNGNVFFSYPTESKVSDEVCDVQILTKPTIVLASVNKTAVDSGAINVSYIKPDQIDTTIYQAPYRFVLKQSVASDNPVYKTIHDTTYAAFANISNVLLVDTLLNTVSNQYVYLVEMYATENGTQKLIETGPTANSLRASIYSTDKKNILSWQANVPWVNDTFTVFRKNRTTLQFDSIGFTTTLQFADTAVVNKTQYCYIIKSNGYYRNLDGLFKTINFSQEICGTPVDTVSPCAPLLQIVSPCETKIGENNVLYWTPVKSCSYDVVAYKIYYKKNIKDQFELIDSLPNTDTFYVDNHDPDEKDITGCYYVAGVDSVGNESLNQNEICIENCPYYELPNVFTPGADGLNDLFEPFPYRFVLGVEMHIYNRWGQEVFSTNNIDILWDGKDQKLKQELPAGVYYYTCLVTENYLEGNKSRILNGTITIIRPK